MGYMNRIDFTVEKYHDWCEWEGVVPFVDDVSLVNLVGEYETARGFHMPGSYGGIMPRRDNPRAYVRYLLGQFDPEDGRPTDDGWTLLLGCNCSVTGCWPLATHVTVDRDAVRWDRFSQPHRPSQDYSGFGPFIFARDEYDRAVEELAATVAALYGKSP